MSEETYKPDKLNGDNFHSWKFNMKMFLIGKDLWDIVSGDEILGEEATPKERDQFRKRDNKALSTISLSVATDIQIYVFVLPKHQLRPGKVYQIALRKRRLQKFAIIEKFYIGWSWGEVKQWRHM